MAISDELRARILTEYPDDGARRITPEDIRDGFLVTADALDELEESGGGTIDATPTNGSDNAVASNGVFDALALKAPLASPALTGIPTAPTASGGTNTTQIATTAFVTAAVAEVEGGESSNPLEYSADYLFSRAINGTFTGVPVATSDSPMYGARESHTTKDSRRDVAFATTYTTYADGNPNGVKTCRFVRHATWAAMQGNLATSHVDTATDIEMFGDGFCFCKHMTLWDSEGFETWYFYATEEASSAVYMKKGHTPEEAAASTAQQVELVGGAIVKDFSVVSTEMGIFGTGFETDSGTANGVLFTAASPEGPFRKQTNIFKDDTRPFAFYRVADGSIAAIGNQLIHCWNGIALIDVEGDYESIMGAVNRPCIQLIKSEGPWTEDNILIGQAAEIIHDINNIGGYGNCCFIPEDNSFVVTNASTNGWYVLELAADYKPTGRGQADHCRIGCWNDCEITTNTPFTVYGTVDIDAVTGIATSSANSGIAGLFGLPTVREHVMDFKFYVGALPSGGNLSTAYKATTADPTNDLSALHIWYDSSGTTTLRYTDEAGTNSDFTFTGAEAATVGWNTLKVSYLSGMTHQVQLNQSAVQTNATQVLTNMARWSALNLKNDIVGYGNQMNGKIESMLISKVLIPTSEVGLQAVTDEGATTTHNITAANITSSTSTFKGSDGTNLSLASDALYVGTAASGAGKAHIRDISLGTFYGNGSGGNGDIRTSGTVTTENLTITSLDGGSGDEMLVVDTATGVVSSQAIPGGGGGGGDALTTDPLSQFAATTSAQLAGVISDETGSGALVFANSPTLVTPALGTPSALVATNATGTAAGLTAGEATAALGIKTATTTVSVSGATAPTSGQVLTATSTTNATWQTPSAGSSNWTVSGSDISNSNAGNVGVGGVASAYAKLAVTGATAISGVLSVGHIGSYTTEKLGVTGNAYVTGNVVADGSISAGTAISLAGSSVMQINGGVQFRLNEAGFASSTFSGGNVIIGSTTNGSHKLDVYGNARVTGNLSVLEYVLFSPITATEASALTPTNGMVVNVSNTNGTFTSAGLWFYNGSSWVQLG